MWNSQRLHHPPSSHCWSLMVPARVARVDIDRVSTMFKDPPAGQQMEYGGAHGQLGPVWFWMFWAKIQYFWGIILENYRIYIYIYIYTYVYIYIYIRILIYIYIYTQVRELSPDFESKVNYPGGPDLFFCLLFCIRQFGHSRICAGFSFQPYLEISRG